MDATKTKRSFPEWAKHEAVSIKLLFRAIPSLVVAIYVVAVVTMNLMASKVIFSNEWIAFNGGMFVSWVPFLISDIVVKHFGAKAANRLSILAIAVNLFCCLIFYIVTLIGTNPEFDRIFSTTWFILIGSTIAFFLSALTNNYSNEFVGRLFKKNPDGIFAYIVRTYVSTILGQLIDNLAFLLPTYMLFAPMFWGPEFGWSFLQCFTCACAGVLVEWLTGALFSPLAYYINRKWKEENVGADYFTFLEGKKA